MEVYAIYAHKSLWPCVWYWSSSERQTRVPCCETTRLNDNSKNDFKEASYQYHVKLSE